MAEQCIGNAQTTDRNRSGAPFEYKYNYAGLAERLKATVL